MSAFSRNLNHHWKCREQKENFQTILVIIFWNFIIFLYRSDSPQIKQNLISSRVVEQLQTQGIRKRDNIRKVLNLGGHTTQCLVSLHELKLSQQQSEKNTQKQIPNVSFPVQFYWITPFCSKYFVWDCRLNSGMICIRMRPPCNRHPDSIWALLRHITVKC